MNELFDTLSYYIIGLLGFVVAFGLAVFIHELGHFLAAKFFKVPVERFVVGFDKEAMGWMPNCFWEKKIGETTYGLSFVPLGGYVKMKGTIHPELEKYFDDGPSENKEATASESNEQESQQTGPIYHGEKASDQSAEKNADGDSENEKNETLVEQAIGDQSALYQKPFYQKFIIYAGGVFMNLVLAGIVIAFLSWKGVETSAPEPTQVGYLPAASPFAEAGLEQGDLITKFEETELETTDDFYEAFGDYASEIVGDRDVSEITQVDFNLEFFDDSEQTTKTATIAYEPGTEDDSKDRIYLGYLFASDAYLDYVIPNKPAHRAKLAEGDLIVAINGEPIEDRPEAAFMIRESANTELVVQVDRDGELFETAVTPVESADEEGIGQVGVMFGSKDKELVKKPLGEAIVTAPLQVYNRTVFYVENLGMLVGKLFSGNVKAVRDNLGGPVAITQMAGYHANLGLDRFLGFLIALNIALAVMNILPIPILDGGHIVFAAYEGTFGKPIPPKVLVPLFNGALIFLLGFVVLVSLSDVLKLFGK